MMHGPGLYQFNVETLAGNLLMGCDISEEEEVEVRFCSPHIELIPSSHSHSVMAKLLGMPLSLINIKHPLYFEKTNKDLYLTVKDLKALELIECDTKALAKFCKSNDINVICVLTTHTFAPENHIHMRCFAPAVGINEDLFTGSVIGGLIAYAREINILKNEKGEIGIEQGHFQKRPGMVRVKYHYHKGQYETEVFAKANHFFSTEIQLN
jgi:PhzF family phenazine biosynthesis protein